MLKTFMKNVIIFLLLINFVFATDIIMYYGVGCPHCAKTDAILSNLSNKYDLDIKKIEVYSNSTNRIELFKLYDKHNIDIRVGGVPTIELDNKTFIVGDISRDEWINILEECKSSCPDQVFRSDSSKILEQDGSSQLTLSVLIGAAIVDSINPCTIAVMVLLISAVLYAKGRDSALLSGLLFSFVIFIMYILYGIGILHTITSFELTKIFYIIVTIAALILALLEIVAFVDYRPGMLAVEMPMFLRSYTKNVTTNATSPIMVIVAAVFCSLFLLPCSSGPYLIVLSLVAKSATVETLSYLILYNFIFILPMLIITLAIFFGKTTVEKIGAMKDKYIRLIHLISGIILFILFFLMLIELGKIY